MNLDAAALAKLRLEELLTFFGINTKVSATGDDQAIRLAVDQDPTGRLIGHHGETLRAIQYLINSMVRNQGHEGAYITVDIAGYKQARAEHLEGKAKQTAERVLETGQAETLKPMTASERRVVHVALSEVAGIETESIGREPNRRLVVKKSGSDSADQSGSES